MEYNIVNRKYIDVDGLQTVVCRCPKNPLECIVDPLHTQTINIDIIVSEIVKQNSHYYYKYSLAVRILDDLRSDRVSWNENLKDIVELYLCRDY